MKFYNIYYLCKELIDVFKNVESTPIDDKKQFYKISGLKGFWGALDTLQNITIFKNVVKSLYDEEYVVSKNANIVETSIDICRNIETTKNTIINQMSIIIDLYESMHLPESHVGIDVKIPNCEDLKEYIKYLNELDFIFTQCPYLLHKDETIKFSSVDVGSNWLNFIIEVSAGSATLFYIINNLATIMDKVMILKSHYTSIKQQEEALKIVQQKNELAENEKEIFDILKKHYMSEIVSSLEKKISPLDDGDQRGRLEKSLDKLVNLLDKGVEIYASLDAPKDVQVLFPTLNETEKLPEAVLKYLEDKKVMQENQE